MSALLQSNMGYRLVQKMGWKSGTGLGKGEREQRKRESKEKDPLFPVTQVVLSPFHWH